MHGAEIKSNKPFRNESLMCEFQHCFNLKTLAYAYADAIISPRYSP